MEFDGPNVVEGAACSKDGMMGAGAGGIIYSCQNLIWKKAASSSGSFWAKDGAQSCKYRGSLGREVIVPSGSYTNDSCGTSYFCVDGSFVFFVTEIVVVFKKYLLNHDLFNY